MNVQANFRFVISRSVLLNWQAIRVLRLKSRAFSMVDLLPHREHIAGVCLS